MRVMLARRPHRVGIRRSLDSRNVAVHHYFEVATTQLGNNFLHERFV